MRNTNIGERLRRLKLYLSETKMELEALEQELYTKKEEPNSSRIIEDFLEKDLAGGMAFILNALKKGQK